MIKITRFLYIHPLSVLLLILGYITRQLEMFAIGYSIMLIHELAHLAAALYIGLMPSKIVVYPCGLNLKLKNKMVYSLADEIILYAAGPLSNICMALISLPFVKNAEWVRVFYIQNVALFVLNMLPVLPLDGGIILKKTAAYFVGGKAADNIMKFISVIIIVILSCIGGYLAYINNFNYSVCFLVLFLLCNIFTASEKYNIDFIRELMFYKEKGRRYNNQKVKTVLMEENSDPKTVASKFATGCYYVVFCVDKNGKISDILTETEILNRILNRKECCCKKESIA